MTIEISPQRKRKERDSWEREKKRGFASMTGKKKTVAGKTEIFGHKGMGGGKRKFPPGRLKEKPEENSSPGSEKKKRCRNLQTRGKKKRLRLRRKGGNKTSRLTPLPIYAGKTTNIAHAKEKKKKNNISGLSDHAGVKERRGRIGKLGSV